MGLFSRKKRVKLAKFRRPEPRRMPSIPSQVEEGLLIVAAGIRMAVKNQAILWALRDHADFDRARYLDAVRVQLLAIAAETDADAARAAREFARPNREHDPELDPEREEPERLQRRQQVLVGLAERLRELADDESHLAALALAARDAAWEEIGVAVKERALLAAPRTVPVRWEDRDAALAEVRFALEELEARRGSSSP